MSRFILILMICATAPAFAGEDDVPTGSIRFYKDWRLACPAADDAKSRCAMAVDVVAPPDKDNADTVDVQDKPGVLDRQDHAGALELQDEEKTKLVRLTIGYGKGETSKLEMVLSVPLTVQVGPGLSLLIDGARRTEPYLTCLPSGCVGVVVMDETTLAALDKATSLGVELTAQSGRAIELPVSLAGYRAAHRAMLADEAKRHPT